MVITGYLVDTSGYLVVMSGYLITTTCYFLLLLVPHFSNNGPVHPTTPADIESLTNCIKPNKTNGPNSIPTKIF